MAGSITKVLAQNIEDSWALYNADAIEVMRGLPDESIHLGIWSPPFESLYTFSDHERDFSNCANSQTFWDHYGFLCKEMSRILKPGRLICIHCMDLPTSKTRDGFIGIRDFSGELIRAHQAAGMIYHSRVCIFKDPVVAMQRTKSIGLLHKQIVKDSALSRMGIADYMIMLRKPGENDEPIAGPFDAYFGDETTPDGPLTTETGKMRTTNRPGENWYSVAVWQRYASPVWMDINQQDVLSHKCARAEDDERHISPLQLTPIRRCIQLWTNPGDTVFSPFAGIGSELYVALELGRKAIGAELKASYYQQAIANIKSLDKKQASLDLFSMGDAA
jgi:DNA modification methylase